MSAKVRTFIDTLVDRFAEEPWFDGRRALHFPSGDRAAPARSATALTAASDCSLDGDRTMM
jgi:hypothetical protein